MDYVMMSQEHTAQIAEIEAQCFSTPWSENSVTSELTNPLSLWVVALDSAVVAGYVGSQSVMGEADMMNIAVRPAYRGQGIGTELVNQLVNRLKENQVYCLTLEVRRSNIQAIELYEKIGFVQIGRRPNYYCNPKEDALILRKDF